MIIGIDPDKTSNGVAVVKDGALEVFNLTLLDLLFYLVLRRPEIEIVYLEAGWKNKKKNYRSNKVPQAVRESIAARVGENHMSGQIIQETLERYGIKFQLMTPKRKKMNGETFYKLTGIKRSNQEQRDAAYMVLPFVNKRK